MREVRKEGAEEVFVESAVTGDSPCSIERQEARGQQSFVTSDTLPVDGLSSRDTEARSALEAAGVIFGDVCPGDPIFQFVTLPAGWKKQPTDHSMWSTLLDAEGKERAAIFYKAAFYDRSAHISVNIKEAP